MSDDLKNAEADRSQHEGNIKVQWTVVKSFEALPKKDDLYFGRVYAIEFCDGTVKIGSTQYCRARIGNIGTYTGRYGNNAVRRIAYTQPHVNYFENEKYLHGVFADKRCRAKELFRISLEDVLSVELTGSVSTEHHEIAAHKIAEFGKGIISPNSPFNVRLILLRSLRNPRERAEEVREQISCHRRQLEALEVTLKILEEWAKKDPAELNDIADNSELIDEVIKEVFGPLE